jgi:CHRD domain
MRRGISATVIAGLTGFWLAGAIGAHAETLEFQVKLSGQNEVPRNEATGSGLATMAYDTESRTLQWSVVHDGVSGRLIGAHIHGPADAGGNAGILVALDGINQNPIHGSAHLTEGQAKFMLDGLCYLNLHTDQHRGGELRGQLLPRGGK